MTWLQVLNYKRMPTPQLKLRGSRRFFLNLSRVVFICSSFCLVFWAFFKVPDRSLISSTVFFVVGGAGLWREAAVRYTDSVTEQQHTDSVMTLSVCHFEI
jgi:hypothetical protein